MFIHIIKFIRSKIEINKIKMGQNDEENYLMIISEKLDKNGGKSLMAFEEINEEGNGELLLQKWRKQFEEAMSKKLAKSERIRFVFCRQIYGNYVERIGQINR